MVKFALKCLFSRETNLCSDICECYWHDSYDGEAVATNLKVIGSFVAAWGELERISNEMRHQHCSETVNKVAYVTIHCHIKQKVIESVLKRMVKISEIKVKGTEFHPRQYQDA